MVRSLFLSYLLKRFLLLISFVFMSPYCADTYFRVAVSGYAVVIPAEIALFSEQVNFFVAPHFNAL
jgi:hypothetical protein